MSAEADRINNIRYLWRHPSNMSLYGIQGQLRPGQAPRDLWPEHDHAFVYLGNPGWWGSMSKPTIAAAKAFLEQHKDSVPQRPGEWCDLHE